MSAPAADRALRPADEVQYLKGVGPRRAELLAKLGIRTVADLLRHYPAGYADRRHVRPIGSLSVGETVTLCGQLDRIRREATRRRGLTIAMAQLRDGTGAVRVVWFGPAYRTAALREGMRLMVEGRVTGATPLELTVAEHEVVEDGDDPLHHGRLVPKHPATAGLEARELRVLVRRALDECADRMATAVPAEIRRRYGWSDLPQALRWVHFPQTPQQEAQAREFLKFEELFLFQAALAMRRQHEIERQRVPPVRVPPEADRRIRARFPFRFTRAQERAVAEIRRDLGSGRPMNRLVQGDVGCGKTAVAAYAILAAVWNRRQAALMAPTEILAEQHRTTFERWLAGSKVRLGFFGGGGSRRQRAFLRARLATGEIDVAIGTHALIEQDVTFRDLAVVVIDEQQRFGVLQRRDLVAKGWRPHVLVMTATPIPRTLAMTVYGELDVTVIDELPPGRRPVRTLFVPVERREAVFDLVGHELARGRQAYFVYPLIDESDRLPLRSAKRMVEEWRGRFPEYRVELLHGAMKKEAKDAAMEAFRSGVAQVLVSTIVVEVGVDVPNASVMVIDNAERYGLAQLHQLRGRIGRGPHESVCILLGQPRGEVARRRIEALKEHSDGFRLAEIDLELRGPGDFLGTRQSGLPELRIADLVADAALVRRARQEAWAWAKHDPEFSTREGRAIRQGIAALYGPRLALGRIG